MVVMSQLDVALGSTFDWLIRSIWPKSWRFRFSAASLTHHYLLNPAARKVGDLKKQLNEEKLKNQQLKLQLWEQRCKGELALGCGQSKTTPILGEVDEERDGFEECTDSILRIMSGSRSKNHLKKFVGGPKINRSVSLNLWTIFQCNEHTAFFSFKLDGWVTQVLQKNVEKKAQFEQTLCLGNTFQFSP